MQIQLYAQTHARVQEENINFLVNKVLSERKKREKRILQKILFLWLHFLICFINILYRAFNII